MTISTLTPYTGIGLSEKKEIVDFLHEHLGEYGDERQAIVNAIEYAMKERSAFGGLVITAREGEKIIGATVLNKTGMEKYVPEYLLVYIAAHEEHRGEGIGKRLMREAIAKCKGNLALHVEADNPAIHLYEKFGFEAKYLEMRLHR